MKILGKRIQQRREDLKITQEELGSMVGKDQKQIWAYESGRTDPKVQVVVLLAKALSTTPDYLLGVSDVVRPVEDESLDKLEREALAMLRNYDQDTREKALNVLKALG